MNYENEFDRIEYDVDTVLFTKDGRIIGNAIITAVQTTHDEVRFQIETDFGNKASCSISELEQLFYKPTMRCSYYLWKSDKK